MVSLRFFFFPPSFRAGVYGFYTISGQLSVFSEQWTENSDQFPVFSVQQKKLQIQVEKSA
jgi:hypothetical protein